MPFPEKTYRLTLTESELADLRHMQIVAILEIEREIQKDRKYVDEFKAAVDAGPPRKFDQDMLISWTGHLENDEKSLARIKRAQKTLDRTEPVLPRARRRR